jgi:gas vesicle protein
MKNIPALLSGLAIGATLMYIFDPDRGNRRRESIREKAKGLSDDAQQAISDKAESLSNSAKGLLQDTKSVFSSGNENTENEKARSQTA